MCPSGDRQMMLGTMHSMTCGPFAASAAWNCSTNSSAVVARVAGTPHPCAIATKSMVGRVRSSISLAFGPPSVAPTRLSSMFSTA